ncbi:MAG: nucleoside deaminase [Nitrospira sp.]|nr:nucleoside deaminase [Nitrospira sp.]
MKSGFPSTSPFRLPPWAIRLARRQQNSMAGAADRMRFVIQLALTNVTAQTGGPFGAAVFETKTGRLIAIGVNVVEPTNCSLAHAEVVALANAHANLKQFDLGAPGMPKLTLVTSCEPCAMCYGAILWSGVRKVVCAARGSDATAIGFDEAPKPRNWVAKLEDRGVSVTRDLCRDEAIAVFQHYQQTGGRIYNARKGHK